MKTLVLPWFYQRNQSNFWMQIQQTIAVWITIQYMLYTPRHNVAGTVRQSVIFMAYAKTKENRKSGKGLQWVTLRLKFEQDWPAFEMHWTGKKFNQPNPRIVQINSKRAKINQVLSKFNSRKAPTGHRECVWVFPPSKFDFSGSCGRLIVGIFPRRLALSIEIYAIAACIGI